MNSKPNKDWGCVLLQGPQKNCRKDGVGDLGVYVGLATPIRFPGISTSLANFRRPLIHFHAIYNIRHFNITNFSPPLIHVNVHYDFFTSVCASFWWGFCIRRHALQKWMWNLRSLTFERRTCYETFLRQVVSSSLLPFLLTFGDSMASASELPVDVLIAGSGGDKSEDAGKKHSHRESGTPSGDGSDDGSDDRNDDENDVAYDSDAGHSGSGQAPFSSEDEDALRACCDKRSVEQSCIVWMSGEKQHLCRALQVSPASHQEEWEGCRKSSYKVEPSKKEEKKMQAELHKQETDRLMSVNCVFGELQFLTLGISRLIPSYLLASWTSAMTSFTFSALECHLPQVRLHSFIYIDPLGLTRLRCDLIWFDDCLIVRVIALIEFTACIVLFWFKDLDIDTTLGQTMWVYLL